MDVRSSAGLLWRGIVLAVAAWMLTACAPEMAEVPPAPAPPVVISAPPPAPAPPPVPAAVPAPPAPAPVPVPAPQREVVAPPPPPPAPPAVPGPVEVTGVEVRDAGPGGLVVFVTGDHPIATYESFTLSDPSRLILDIPNAIHAIPQPISARPPLVMAIRSSQYRERPVQIVRLVLDLRGMLPYRVSTAQNQLRIELGAMGETPAPAPAAAPAAPPAKAAGKVTRVDLQSVRGRQQIVIRTSGPVTYKVSESTSPLALTVDVSGASIESAAARTLDLRQVTSPVSRLQAAQHQTAPEPVVRVVADLRAATRYEVRQTASAIVVDLLTPVRAAPPAAKSPAPPASAPTAPAPAPAPAPAEPGTPTAGKLSMDFKDADINNLLRIIAEVSGMNVIAGGDVSGKVTVRLVNVDWQQALDVILKINGMGYEIDGNIIRVAPQTKLATEQKAREDAKARDVKVREDVLKAEREQKKEEKKEEPLQDAILPVNYAKAADVVKNLDRLKTVGRPDASIVVDDRTQKLIIRETAASLTKMKELLKELDRPTPQVLIEARVVEATRSFAQSLGIEWGIYDQNLTAGNNKLTPVSIFSSVGGASFTTPTDPVPLAISFPAAGGSAVGIMVGSVARNFALNARLSASESEGKTRTLSSPKVATLDNQEAEIKQGTQLPYTTVDSSGRTVIAFADAFIRLKVTPHITNDRRISLKVDAEKSSPDEKITYATGFVYSIKTAKATTNVLVSNGSTIVLGGLMTTDEKWSEPRVPWLGKIPILGMLFRSNTVSDVKNELLIFLTPTILEEARVM